MHVNPITHDGLSTIGYDADGAPGCWSGVMEESCDTLDWTSVIPGVIFTDMDDETWVLIEREEDEVWCWQGPDGRIYDPEVILEQFGDK
jgi:hypothetical protein